MLDADHRGMKSDARMRSWKPEIGLAHSIGLTRFETHTASLGADHTHSISQTSSYDTPKSSLGHHPLHRHPPPDLCLMPYAVFCKTESLRFVRDQPECRMRGSSMRFCALGTVRLRMAAE